jgi:hypothetical protein
MKLVPFSEKHVSKLKIGTALYYEANIITITKVWVGNEYVDFIFQAKHSSPSPYLKYSLRQLFGHWSISEECQGHPLTKIFK